MTALRVGLCGCGNMGSAIAARLANAVDLTVYDLDAARADAISEELGVSVAPSLLELASTAQAVVLSLPHPAASLDVLEVLAPNLRRSSLVVETSTVAPADMLALESICGDGGIHVVEAAILSGVRQMREGSSTLLVGGSDEAVDAAGPVLDALAPRQIHLGPLGSGMAAKIANNAVSHAVMVVLVEAAAIACAAGVPPPVLADLLADPDGGLLRPFSHRFRERVLAGEFTGGMPTEAALKDSELAQRLAEDAGVPLYALKAAHVPYELAVAAGHARLDYSAIALLWEEWTGRTLRSDTDAS